MELAKCKTCGERHRVTASGCPKFAHTPRKRGRPLPGDKDKTLTATAPWTAAGVSRASWYRERMKAQQAKERKK